MRHTSKAHGQDTRSFKRRNRSQSIGAATSTTDSSESKKTRKSTSRSKRKPDNGNFAAVQSNTETDSKTTASTTSTVTTTSPSTSYYTLPDSGFSSANRIAATSNPTNYSNSTIMLSSTSTSLNPFPKMTLVDHPSSTSALTASFTHARSYPSSFNNFEPSSSNFHQYISNGTAFNQFIPESSCSPYSLTLHPPNTANYLNYDYHKPPSNSNNNNNNHNNANSFIGGNSQQHESFASASTSHLPASLVANSSNNISFKTITSSIVDGFNTCIELEYNNAGMNFNAPPISGVQFGESGHSSRFHTPFN